MKRAEQGAFTGIWQALIKSHSGNLKVREHLGDLGIDGRIFFK
jgi:hypothetical protein